MLSFKKFLLEYNVDSIIRGVPIPKTEKVKPSLSTGNVLKSSDKMRDILARLHREGKLDALGYKPFDVIEPPHMMDQEELERHRAEAAKHLSGSTEMELNSAAQELVLTDPMANVELQDFGGVRGTNPRGQGSDESRRPAGENLMASRRKKK